VVGSEGRNLRDRGTDPREGKLYVFLGHAGRSGQVNSRRPGATWQYGLEINPGRQENRSLAFPSLNKKGSCPEPGRRRKRFRAKALEGESVTKGRDSAGTKTTDMLSPNRPSPIMQGGGSYLEE